MLVRLALRPRGTDRSCFVLLHTYDRDVFGVMCQVSTATFVCLSCGVRSSAIDRCAVSMHRWSRCSVRAVVSSRTEGDRTAVDCYIGLHILMSIKVMVDTASTVAMKRGDKRSHSHKIDCLANPSATLRCIASSPPHSPLHTHQDSRRINSASTFIQKPRSA